MAVRRRGVEVIKRGLSETVVYAAEVDYNQTVVHKTARQRYYCHLNGLALARRESPPSQSDSEDGARGRDLEIKCPRSFCHYTGQKGG